MSALPARAAPRVEADEPLAPPATSQPPRAKRGLASGAVAVACVLGAALVLGATTQGVGLSPDSVQYLTAAANLSDGRGLLTIAWEGDVVPLRHFPPAYPALLASGRSLGLASEATARGLNVALMVATIVVAFVVARRLIPKSPWPAVTVATLFATAHDLVVAHSMAWTEPLYLTLTLLGCLLLARALERASLRLLLSTSALVGVTATVRYVGVANLAALGLAVVIWWPREWWRRVRTAAVAFTGAPWLPSLSRCVCSTARAKAEPNQHAGAQA